MLILTRKINQSIIINDNIEITIIETKGEQVKIGIKAPKDVSIYRTEIYKEIQNENIKAAQNSPLPQNDLTKISSILKGLEK